jgi:CRP/FNR family transcriptional regulator
LPISDKEDSMNRKELLARVETFKGLRPDEIDALAGICTEGEYKAGQVIFEENSRGDTIYILEEGKVCIDLTLTGQSNVASIYRVPPGEIFGELALVDEGPRSATTRCETDSRVLEMKKSDLFDLFESNNHIGYTVLKNVAGVLAGRLRNTNRSLVASILTEMGRWY